MAETKHTTVTEPPTDATPHTPGRWNLYLSQQNPGAFNITANDMVICQRGVGTPNGEEGIANARLIAAAPDLLDALQQTKCALRALVYSCETEGWSGQQALAIWRTAMAHSGDLDARVETAITKALGL